MFLLLRLKTLVKSLVLPPVGPLLLAILGILLIKNRPTFSRGLLVTGIGSLWLLSTPIVSDAFARMAEHYPPLDLDIASRAQAIVILGGGGQRAFAPEYQGPAAEPQLLERLSYGAYLSHNTGLPILVTGLAIEADAMHDTLQRNFGIETRWYDNKSYDTFENARNSVRILKAAGVDRILLVTRATHMWRSVQEFTAAGMDVIPAPVGILAPRDSTVFRYIPNPDALQRSCAAINELLGVPARVLLAASHLRRQ